MQLLDPPGESSPDWDRIRPVLDEAMANLGDTDRDAVVLRFFKNEDLRAVGTALGTSEDAAQKRVTRALEKLRVFLLRRGVTLSATALATALTGSAVQAAPAALASTISTAVIAGAAAVGSTFNFLNLMSMTKLKAGLLSAAVVVGAGTPVVMQQQTVSRLRAENETLRVQSAQVLRSESEQFAGMRADGDELERLRRDVAELHRLRSEVSRLRREKEDAARFQAENKQLREELTRVAAAAQKAPGTTTPEQDEFKRQGLDRLNYTKQWMLAFMLFAEENEGRLPQDFVQAQALYPGGEEIEGLSPEQFEIVYSGKVSDIKTPARTIVIRERESRLAPDGRLAKAYGFADGHSEIHHPPDGNFERFESERMASSTTP